MRYRKLPNNKLITYKIHNLKSVRIDASYDMPVISIFVFHGIL
jgi:hypothetical protein